MIIGDQSQNQDLKDQIVHGGIWLGLEKFLSFLTSFLGGIILARLLEPEDFGAVAMATGVFLIIGRLTGIGIDQELIRLNENDQKYETWLSTYFFINAGLTVIILFCAILLAYLTPFLSPLAKRVFSVIAVGWSINILLSPARSLLHKHMRFRAMSLLGFLSVVGGMTLSLLMAWGHYGIWSLAVPSSLFLIITSLWAYTLERPPIRKYFARDAFRRIVKKAPFYMLFGISEEGYQRGDDIILGYFLGDGILGLYRRAYALGDLLHNQIGVILNKLGYPVFAGVNHSHHVKYKLLSVNMKFILYVVFSLVIFLALYIEPIIRLLYGSKWLPSAQYFIYLVPFAVLWPVYHNFKSFLIASGEIRVVALVDFLKLLLMIAGALLLIGSWQVLGVAVSVDLAIFTGVTLLGYNIFRNQFSKAGFLFKPLVFIMLTILGLFMTNLFFMIWFLPLVLIFIFLERKDLISLFTSSPD